MPYQPRAPFPLACAHCGLVFAAKHLGRKYCSTPCKSLATQARKQARPTDLAAQLAAAEAELARVQAALAALSPPVAPSAPLPVGPPRPVRPLLVIPAFKAPVTAQTLLRQAKRLASQIRVTAVTRKLGQVYVPGTDPHTELQQHVAAKWLWWRHTTLQATSEWVHANTFWVGTDERLWVETAGQGLVIVVEVRTSPLRALSPLS